MYLRSVLYPNLTQPYFDTTLILSMIRFYSLPVFVDRSRRHAKRNRTIHIWHHSSSRRCTYGWWVCSFQTLQNQESPVRYDGINDSKHGKCRCAYQTGDLF